MKVVVGVNFCAFACLLTATICLHPTPTPDGPTQWLVGACVIGVIMNGLACIMEDD